jgi:hypothetical protein
LGAFFEAGALGKSIPTLGAFLKQGQKGSRENSLTLHGDAIHFRDLSTAPSRALRLAQDDKGKEGSFAAGQDDRGFTGSIGKSKIGGSGDLVIGKPKTLGSKGKSMNHVRRVILGGGE